MAPGDSVGHLNANPAGGVATTTSRAGLLALLWQPGSLLMGAMSLMDVYERPGSWENSS
jgi:hypothetical protein